MYSGNEGGIGSSGLHRFVSGGGSREPVGSSGGGFLENLVGLIFTAAFVAFFVFVIQPAATAVWTGAQIASTAAIGWTGQVIFGPVGVIVTCLLAALAMHKLKKVRQDIFGAIEFAAGALAIAAAVFDLREMDIFSKSVAMAGGIFFTAGGASNFSEGRTRHAATRDNPAVRSSNPA